MNPDSKVQGVILFIEQDEGNWVPLKVEVNSWVCLNPGNRGGHARDAMRHGGTNIIGSYKARVVRFRLNRSGGVASVLVNHAYMYRQLCLDPTILNVQTTAINCKSSPA
jgi:hypothetical protein